MNGGETAAELLARYAVYGRFYTRRIDGVDYALRSHLEIFDRSVYTPQQAIERPADLIAVMMNPGASRPLAPDTGAEWSAAQPDRTQYQLMKLARRAHAAGQRLDHIRVINLSDLRTPKSAELFALLPQIGGWHSVFAPARQAELIQALAGDAPVLRAWGLSPALDTLARRAIAATEGRRILGLARGDSAYRHPLPQRADLQRDWLEAVGRQLGLGPA